jgi:hypothetical protein
MTEKSDKELQEFILLKQTLDYTDEETQKRMIISHDMGAEISLYAWIHRYDSPAGEILTIAEVNKILADDFMEAFTEYMREGLDG